MNLKETQEVAVKSQRAAAAVLSSSNTSSSFPWPILAISVAMHCVMLWLLVTMPSPTPLNPKPKERLIVQTVALNPFRTPVMNSPIAKAEVEILSAPAPAAPEPQPVAEPQPENPEAQSEAKVSVVETAKELDQKPVPTPEVNIPSKPIKSVDIEENVVEAKEDIITQEKEIEPPKEEVAYYQPSPQPSKLIEEQWPPKEHKTPEKPKKPIKPEPAKPATKPTPKKEVKKNTVVPTKQPAKDIKKITPQKPAHEIKKPTKPQPVKKPSPPPKKDVPKAAAKKEAVKHPPAKNSKVPSKPTPTKPSPSKNSTDEVTKAKKEKERQDKVKAEEKQRQEAIAVVKAKQQKLLQRAKESIAKIDTNVQGTASSTGSSYSQPTPKALTSLHIDALPLDLGQGNGKGVASFSSHERSYVDELVSRLKLSLRLPEYGDVKLRLTLERSGTLVKMTITSAASQINKKYIDKILPTLKFPPFGENFSGQSQYTFEIHLSNDT